MQPTNRYTCQIKLPGFGAEAQRKLAHAKVLIAGLGGLGCPAAAYLASAGVGSLTLLDFDRVEAANLHRQTLFTPGSVGNYKADAAAQHLRQQNPTISIKSLPQRLTSENASRIVKEHDIILDCTDNYEARLLLNDACVLAGKPLVFGAAYQFQGQVAVWNVPNLRGSARSPHFRDVFPSAEAGVNADCATGGVMPTLTGIIGCMQASEAIKYLTGLPGLLAGKLLLFDVNSMQSRIIALPKSSTVAIKSLARSVPTISVSELKKALPKRTYQLIDVRTPEEHSAFNIGGQLIPLPELAARLGSFNPANPAVFYCATGKRSATAVRDVLSIHPKAKVFSLQDGIAAWQDTNP